MKHFTAELFALISVTPIKTTTWARLRTRCNNNDSWIAKLTTWPKIDYVNVLFIKSRQ